MSDLVISRITLPSGTTYDIMDLHAQQDIERLKSSVSTMTMAQYEALTPAQKADGTIRFITDANAYPDADNTGF